LTRDERLVVIHDGAVDRTSDGTGKVSEMTLAMMKALDAGTWRDTRFAGQRFLTLDETLDLMPPETRLNVHIKATEEDRERVMALTAGTLLRRDRLSTAFVASDEKTLQAARQIAPDVTICNLSTQPAETYVERSWAIGCRVLQPGNRMTTPELVAAAHHYGMEVNPFYANDESEMRRLIGCGVDGILTDFPERLMRLREIL
jgi:glycerophosphoryl diester phosphodiesterase